MIGDLFINGVDAYTMGVSMGDGFLDSIGGAIPLKQGVENKSALEHGKRSTPSKMLDERDLTLTFHVEGSTGEEFKSFKAAFFELLYNGSVTVYIPANGPELYRLEYKNQTSYAQNYERTFCKIAVKFCEPNPKNRSL